MAKSVPLGANCNPRYRAIHQSGRRHESQIQVSVVHSAEALDAEGVARYFTSPRSGGSAQRSIGAEECWRCLPDSIIPWAAPPFNTTGVHNEPAALARWTTTQWLRHPRLLRRLARKTAQDCHKHHLRAVWLTEHELRAIRGGNRRVTGITTHALISSVFKMSSHWDPGNGFPKRIFLGLVRHYLRQIQGL
jgi:hypothetical protein